MIYLISLNCIILLPLQLKYLLTANQPQCIIFIWHHQYPFVLLYCTFFWILKEEWFYLRNIHYHLLLPIILYYFFIKNIIWLLCISSPILFLFPFPLMFSFCSPIEISSFRSNRLFSVYFAKFEWKVPGGHGDVSNYVISSVLFFVIPIFCSAAK